MTASTYQTVKALVLRRIEAGEISPNGDRASVKAAIAECVHDYQERAHLDDDLTPIHDVDHMVDRLLASVADLGPLTDLVGRADVEEIQLQGTKITYWTSDGRVHWLAPTASVAEREITDIDGGRHVERWFVDCKHYQAGVPPTALQGLFTWAQAERPHVALVIASGWTNGAKDFIRQYLDNNRPPFRIKHWERPILEKLTAGNPGLLDRFLVGGLRTQSEIITAEEEMFDRVWYTRKQVLEERLADGEDLNVPEETLHRMRTAVAAVEARYGKENLGPTTISSGEWSTASCPRCGGCSAWNGTSSTPDPEARTLSPESGNPLNATAGFWSLSCGDSADVSMFTGPGNPCISDHDSSSVRNMACGLRGSTQQPRRTSLRVS